MSKKKEYWTISCQKCGATGKADKLIPHFWPTKDIVKGKDNVLYEIELIKKKARAEGRREVVEIIKKHKESFTKGQKGYIVSEDFLASLSKKEEK